MRHTRCVAPGVALFKQVTALASIVSCDPSHHKAAADHMPSFIFGQVKMHAASGTSSIKAQQFAAIEIIAFKNQFMSPALGNLACVSHDSIVL